MYGSMTKMMTLLPLFCAILSHMVSPATTLSTLSNLQAIRDLALSFLLNLSSFFRLCAFFMLRLQLRSAATSARARPRPPSAPRG